MSESQSVQLSMLSKEDFKNLAKQAEKAKRDQNAKQAKISTPYEPTLPASVHFDAPVKVSDDRDSKLLGVLGRYEDMSSLIMKQDRYFGDMVGVERQPTTPLPGKGSSRGAFFNKPGSSSRGLTNPHSNTKPSSSSVKPPKTSANDASANNDAKYKTLPSTTGVENKTRHGTTSHGVIHSSGHNLEVGSMKPPHSIDRPDSRAVGGTQNSFHKSDYISSDLKPVQASSHNTHRTSDSDTSHGQSARKESMSQSIRHPPVSNREPVLDSLKQELIDQSKSVAMLEEVGNKTNKYSKSSASNSEGCLQVLEGRSVLQVKEENRNGAVFNGAKLKHKPKLQIAENVEEMLQEFLELPQPLTGIQTPFKDSKFPFQEKFPERKDLSSSQSSKDNKKDASSIVLSSQRSAPAQPVRIVEEIQEKDSSSDSGSSSGSDDDSDESEDEDGEKNDKEGGIDLEEMINNPTSASKFSANEKRSVDTREHRGRTVLAQKVPPLGTDSSTHTSKVPDTSSMDHSSYSSSESSSSSSESGSDSGSDSESDKDVSDDEPPHSTPQGTPSKVKSSPSELESSASPASKNWGLSAFLRQAQSDHNFNLEKKPLSAEAPASDKSEADHDDEVTDMKRGADHISDENPPSNDQDIIGKPMSADEFSPPTHLEQKLSVLSPIKSPPPVQMKSPIPAVKSPMKHSFHRNKAAEKFYKSPRAEPDSVESNKTQLTMSPMKPSPALKNKVHIGRKSKQKFLSPAQVESSDSDAESEIDVVHCSSESALDSPQKPLPQSLQTSQAYLSQDTSVGSKKPSSSSAKRKDSKRDKLHRDMDLVKLKSKESPSSGSRKQSCDSRQVASSVSARVDPIEDMLQTFPGEKPVSPIPNIPSKQDLNDQLRRVGSAVSPVRRIPSHHNVQCAVRQPSVLVKIDLNRLGNHLCIDKNSQDFLKPKLWPDHHRKHQKLTSAKSSLSSDSKPKKEFADPARDKLSKSTSSLPSANISDDFRDRKYKSEKQSISSSSLTKKEVKVGRSHVPEMPDFDSLPQKPAMSENSSSASSSESDSEEEDTQANVSVHNSLSASAHSSFSPSAMDKKKRKLEASRDDDQKRRKTSSKSPISQSVPDPMPSETYVEVVSTGKRERHNSGSSQHSTYSNVSQRSTQSQRTAQSQRGHKRAQTQEEVPNKTLKPSSSSSSLDRSKSTAVVTPVIKNEVKTESVDMLRLNGFSTEPVMHHPMAAALHQSVLFDREEEAKILSADDYHRQAKKYKYQADDMEGCLAKYVLYLESVLYFIQCGYAMEKQHMITEASNMYKDTYKFVSHQYHQFRMMHDAESSDKAQKLAVLCLRIQSLIYLKLYMLKKNETVKLKRILEDNTKSIKSSSQPKAPSAPSPHQASWNRSTGTPSPMSPTPSPANSVCSVGSVGSDITPSKLCNGTSGQSQIVPPGSVIVSQRIHSITQKYFSNTCYLIQAHELWDQATNYAARDSRDFFAQLDLECGPLTFHSSLLHLVRYVRQGVSRLSL